MRTEHRAHAPPARRPAAELLGAATLSLALFAALSGCTPTAAPGAPAVVQGPRPAVTQFADSLTEPLVVRSVNGVLNATLDVTMADLPVIRSGKAIVGDTVSVTDSVR